MTNYCFSFSLFLPGSLRTFILSLTHTKRNTSVNIVLIEKYASYVCLWQANGSKFMNRMNKCVCVTHRTHISSIFHRNSCAFIYERWSRRIWHITLKYQMITCHDDCMIASFIFKKAFRILSQRRFFLLDLNSFGAIFVSFSHSLHSYTWSMLFMSVIKFHQVLWDDYYSLNYIVVAIEQDFKPETRLNA